MAGRAVIVSIEELRRRKEEAFLDGYRRAIEEAKQALAQAEERLKEEGLESAVDAELAKLGWIRLDAEDFGCQPSDDPEEPPF